jgi:hypothetical protein
MWNRSQLLRGLHCWVFGFSIPYLMGRRSSREFKKARSRSANRRAHPDGSIARPSSNEKFQQSSQAERPFFDHAHRRRTKIMDINSCRSAFSNTRCCFCSNLRRQMGRRCFPVGRRLRKGRRNVKEHCCAGGLPQEAHSGLLINISNRHR